MPQVHHCPDKEGAKALLEQIIRPDSTILVKASRGMQMEELTAFLKAYASGLITLPDGMMEAEAAPDPDDEDMEGMKDGEDEA